MNTNILTAKPRNIVYVFGPKTDTLRSDDIITFKVGMSKNNDENFNQRLAEDKRHTFGHNVICRYETNLSDGPVNRYIKYQFPERVKTQRGPGHEVYKSTVDNFLFVKNEITKFVNGKNTGRAKSHSFAPRKEQIACLEKTKEYISNTDNMNTPFLWYCKMRFGKTFTFYQLIMEMDLKNILILTRRPTDTKEAWIKDTDHIDFDFGENDIVDASKQTIPIVLKQNSRNIIFVSFQDLDDLSKDKFTHIRDAKWDMIVIDEAHFGALTKKAQDAMSKLERKYPLLYLSGTPFRMLEDGTIFNDNNTYTWSYIDEQRARNEELIKLGQIEAEKNGEYFWLCPLRPFVIDIMDTNAFSEAGLFTEDEGFTFTKLFAVEENNGKQQFKYQRFIIEFLNFLGSAKMPYGRQAHTGAFNDIELTHTLWHLPGVKECRLLKSIMEKHNRFKNYTIIPAYDDNDGLNKNTIKMVKENIASIGIDRRIGTITLTCGKLTHGVSIPEWGSIFVLSDLASSQSYFQLIFRGQTPRPPKNGVLGKYACGVFDFSPNRTLNHYHELAKAISKNDDIKSTIKEVLLVLNPICFNGNEFRSFNIDDVLNNFKFGYASRSMFASFFKTVSFDLDQEIMEDIKGMVVNKSVKSKELPIGDHKLTKGKNTKNKNQDDEIADDIEIDNNIDDESLEKEISDEQAKEIVINGLAKIPLLLYYCNGENVEEFVNSIDNKVCKSLTGLSARNFKSILLGKKNDNRRKEINTIINKFRSQEGSI